MFRLLFYSPRITIPTTVGTVPAVNTAEWLMAIAAHPDIVDTDLVVAAALASGDADVDRIDPESVTDSPEELIALGFLEVGSGCRPPEG